MLSPCFVFQTAFLRKTMFRNFDLGVFLLAVLPVLLALTVREVVRG